MILGGQEVFFSKIHSEVSFADKEKRAGVILFILLLFVLILMNPTVLSHREP